MSTDRSIITGEAVAVELRPAGIGSRGVALIIDFLAQFAITLAWVYAISRVGDSGDSAAVQAVVLTLFVGTILGYPVLFETLWRGRTLGKATMGLRVVRDDGGPIRFRHAFVRGLVGVVVDRPGISSGLLALIPMLSTQRSKRLGDLAAGTVVVQERVPSRLPAQTAIPAELTTWAAGLDLSGVNDGLAVEIRQFLGRARQLSPAVREQLGNRLLAQVAANAGPLPPGMTPWTYLQTALAERSRRELQRLSGSAAPTPDSPPPGRRDDDEPPRPTSRGPFAPPA